MNKRTHLSAQYLALTTCCLQEKEHKKEVESMQSEMKDLRVQITKLQHAMQQQRRQLHLRERAERASEGGERAAEGRWTPAVRAAHADHQQRRQLPLHQCAAGESRLLLLLERRLRARDVIVRAQRGRTTVLGARGCECPAAGRRRHGARPADAERGRWNQLSARQCVGASTGAEGAGGGRGARASDAAGSGGQHAGHRVRHKKKVEANGEEKEENNFDTSLFMARCVSAAHTAKEAGNGEEKEENNFDTSFFMAKCVSHPLPMMIIMACVCVST
jgi:hypothetical protein